ncbi:MAG: outer membrane lipoprotein carrier protein LolA [Nitrospirae bacterium]|nr:outer membrane lipoprotein carrier protein LolA [Nitrospirota bacterium]
MKAMTLSRTMSCFWASAVLVGASLGIPAPPARAAEDPLAGMIQKIQTAYETTADWEADFEQVTRIEGFETAITSRGRLYIKKPGRLRWDYREPNHHQVVVNVGKIWVYTPEQQQVVVGPFAQVSDSQLPLHLLTGVGRLDEDFAVRWTDPARPRPDGLPALTLVPKDPRTGLARLELEVDPAGYFITRLTLFEANGNQSRFRFSRIRRNTGLKDRFFVFSPPKGVVVVESPRIGP